MKQNLEEIRNLNIQKKISRLRVYGNSFEEITKIINKEFDKNYTSMQIKKLLDKYVAQSNVITNKMKSLKQEATSVRRGWEKEIDEMIELLNDRIKKYLSMADKFLDEAFTSGNRRAFFNDLPAFNKLLKSLQDQIRLLRETQNKIQVNQQNLVLNKTQILQVVNQRLKQKEEETGMQIHPGTGELIPIKNFKKKKVLV